MLKNVAGQNITAVLLDTAGAVVTTGTTTVYVLGDAGTQASMGTATHEGNGAWSIDVTQAESNYDDIGFTWVNAGAVTVHQHVFTDATYDRIGATGSGLTALATQASVDTVDTNVDAILVDTGTTLPASIATVDSNVDAILVDTGTTIPAQITGLNDLSAADVNAEVDTALADIHLDHLLAADYDPATPPGVSTALLNEIMESDAGVARFTANALELAPTGGSAPTAAAIRAEIDSNSTQLAAIVADTNELQTDLTDGGRLDLLIDAILADTGELQTDWADGGRLDLLLDAIPTDPFAPTKNVALNNIIFYMVDANDHITPETGLSSITAEISQDGGAFSACTNAVAEISDGYYRINLTQAEMNADKITVRFAHANADETGYTFSTTET